METPEVRVSRAPPQADQQVVAVVREALLPMFLWIDVPVNRVSEQEMTVVERFLLEAALALPSPLTVDEVAEAMGAPADLVDRIARRLATLQLLAATGDGYEAVASAAQEALRRAALVEYRPDYLTFLFLPRTGELLAFESGQGTPLLNRVTPAFNAPTPDDVRGRGRAELLRQRVAEGAVLGLPTDLAHILEADDDEPIPDQCPVYRCSGVVRMHSDELRAHLSVYEGSAPKGRRRGRKGGQTKATLEIAGAMALMQGWLDQVAELGSPARLNRVLQALGCEHTPDVTATRTGPVEWTVELDGDTAASVAATRTLLTDAVGVELHSEEFILAVAVRLTPTDTSAALLFAVDDAVAWLRGAELADLQTGDLHSAVAAGARAHELPHDAIDPLRVIDRLWTLGHYQQVYTLRRAEDFAYA